MSQSALPYVLPDCTVVAADFNSLLNSALQNPIDETETGGTPPVGTVGSMGGCNGTHTWVWTDTSQYGVTFTEDCSGWTATTTDTFVGVGAADLTTLDWTAACSASNNSGICRATAALYCFQQ